MKQEINDYIQILTWNDARPFVKKSDERLFKIIEEIDPGKEFKFIKVRYPFGTTILDNDIVYLPDKPFSSSPAKFADVPLKLKNELTYQSLPFGFVTENSLEIYKEYPDKILSVALSGPTDGMELGIFEYFGLTACYSVTAGARSLYMIPKISELRNHKRLMKKFSLNCFQPKNIFKQWRVFKDVYSSGLMKSQWETEIIYLNSPWHKYSNDKSIKWQSFKNYLHMKGFEHSGFGRKQELLNLVWEKMTSFIKDEAIRPDPYTIDTLKHLIYVYVGALSGYRPATDDFAGPITEIQENYIDTYGLTQIPTIMRPIRFNRSKDIPVYYSMQFPTMLSSTPNIRKPDTIIQEMSSLNNIKEFLLSRLTEIGNIRLDNERLSDILQKMKLEYFHSDMYSYGKNIRPTKEIPDSDKDFLYSPNQEKNLPFSESGAFIKGCVRVSRSN